jgi:CheY-like chemotaxis protein
MISKTILLVDDDADLLQVLSARCQKMGLAVLHARNLLTATAMLENCAPDLICIDVEMPTGSGLRFCESLASDPMMRGVSVIVLTGRKDIATIDECSRLGLHYVCKSPDIWSTLEPLLGRLVEQSMDRERATTGIRPRKLPEHLIPLWPEEADAGTRQSHSETKTHGSERSSSAAAAPSTRRVLVADDDADLVEMLRERIKSLGCKATGVSSSLDAVNEIHRAPPDLVILDVNMPTGSGLSVCEMLSTDEELRKLPVIILTGCSDEKTIRRCHDLLVFYVQKSADVWNRIEPLVRELLHLGDAPIDPATMQPAALESSQGAIQSQQARSEIAAADRGASGATPPAVSGQPLDEGEANTLVDAVFAMLGAGSEMTRGVSIEAPHGVVETPWILSIDDDFDFSDALKLRLDEYGIAVSRAANGMAGYWMAYTTRARAILLDYQMPNGQGDYILRRLKENPVTRDIPVIMITGVKDKMLERRVLSMGAKAYLVKPVDFEQLRRVMEEFIPKLRRPATAQQDMASVR